MGMFQIILIILIMICGFFLLIMYVDCNRFVTVSYEIESDKVSREYTFALLSDLHNKSFGKRNEKLLKAIEELDPDAILTAGDMITAQKGVKHKRTAEFMERLASKYPVYYGMGNHEHCLSEEADKYGNIYEEYIDLIKKAGIEPLINESVIIPSANISVCGLQIDRRFFGKFKQKPLADDYLNDRLGKADPKRFQILIAHNPDYFEDYAKWGADLVVSDMCMAGL